MSKLPSDVRLTVARKTNGTVWELQEIVKILKAEVEAREASILLKTNEHKHDNRKYGDKPQPGGGKDIATGAFLNNSSSQPGNNICVYCSKQHFSASCKEVNDVSKRRDILMRDRRCFMCLKKGHRASNCERTTNCRKCNKRHHQSICNLNKVQQERDPIPVRNLHNSIRQRRIVLSKPEVRIQLPFPLPIL